MKYLTGILILLFVFVAYSNCVSLSDKLKKAVEKFKTYGQCRYKTREELIKPCRDQFNISKDSVVDEYNSFSMNGFEMLQNGRGKELGELMLKMCQARIEYSDCLKTGKQQCAAEAGFIFTKEQEEKYFSPKGSGFCNDKANKVKDKIKKSLEEKGWLKCFDTTEKRQKIHNLFKKTIEDITERVKEIRDKDKDLQAAKTVEDYYNNLKKKSLCRKFKAEFSKWWDTYKTIDPDCAKDLLNVTMSFVDSKREEVTSLKTCDTSKIIEKLDRIVPCISARATVAFIGGSHIRYKKGAITTCINVQPDSGNSVLIFKSGCLKVEGVLNTDNKEFPFLKELTISCQTDKENNVFKLAADSSQDVFNFPPDNSKKFSVNKENLDIDMYKLTIGVDCVRIYAFRITPTNKDPIMSVIIRGGNDFMENAYGLINSGCQNLKKLGGARRKRRNSDFSEPSEQKQVDMAVQSDVQSTGDESTRAKIEVVFKNYDAIEKDDDMFSHANKISNVGKTITVMASLFVFGLVNYIH